MELISRGTVFEGHRPGVDGASAFSSLCRLSSDEILCVFQNGPEKNHAECTVCLCRSGDQGASWSAPERPFASWAAARGLTVHVAYLAEIAPGRLLANLMLCDHLGDPELPLFDPQTGGVLPIRIGLSESSDRGATWTEPRILSTGRFDEVPTAIMSPVLRAAGGELILPFETSKNYDDPGVWEHYAAGLVSRNEGETWDEVLVTAHDPDNQLLYWDQRVVRLVDGRLLAFYWTSDASGQELTAHRSVSSDGLTWPPRPTDTRLAGQPWPVPLDGEAVVVLTVDRYGERSIKAALTHDLGDTWAEELTLYRHPAPTFTPEAMTEALSQMALWSFGLPSGIRLGSDEILATWYSGQPAATRIEWARLRI